MQNLTEIRMRITKVNARIVLTALPGARAACRKDADGYLIIVDRDLSDESKINAVAHELAHIELGHLDNDCLSDEDKEKEVKQRVSGGESL